MKNIPRQLKIDSPIPPVSGNCEFDQFRDELIIMDDILCQSGIEQEVIDFVLESEQAKSDERRKEQNEPPKPLGQRAKDRHRDNARTLFRAALLRKKTREGLRVCCQLIAESPIRQWFCGINRFVEARIFSKSKLGDFENRLGSELLNNVHTKLLSTSTSETTTVEETNQIGLATPVSLDTWYVDSTCLEANIHFPVDWVLLVDITRTLMKAVAWIRRRGIVNRMPKSPKGFISDINRLAIAMSNCRRTKDAQKHRKQILREMKKLIKKASCHARKHAELLKQDMIQSGQDSLEAVGVLGRIKNIQDQVDYAVWQAHERIIGDRRVPNNQKILSVYEEDVHVIVRGKSNAEVEFGNKLFIAEQEDGLVVDYKLMKDKPVGDPASLLECMDKIATELNLIPSVVTGDRGFDSPAVRSRLDKKSIYNAVACRSVPAMEVKLKDPTFRRHQKRRAQTEGRIAIIKGFTSNPMLQRGFEHRNIHLGISVVSHNLWKLAVMRQQELRQENEAGAQAA